MSNIRTLEFSAQQINWGLAYAENEYGEMLDPILLWVFATAVRTRMNTTGRPFDDVRTEVLDKAFRTEFIRNPDRRRVQNLRDAYSGTIGKMFNNRKNIRHPNFSPSTRVSPKKPKLALITREGGQIEAKLK